MNNIKIWADETYLNSYKTIKGTKWVLGSIYTESSKELYENIIYSLLHFTYRNEFTPMSPYPITTDSGWGCMLRVAQMMIDFPGIETLYSIHNMVQCGYKYNKLPGEWFGPSDAAKVMKDLSLIYCHKLNGNLIIHVPNDGIINIDQINELCKIENSNIINNIKNNQINNNNNENNEIKNNEKKIDNNEIKNDNDEINNDNNNNFFDPLLKPPPELMNENLNNNKLNNENEWDKNLLLIIPLRLGLQKISEQYIPAILECLHLKSSMGILGGRPGHAIYFIGHINKILLGLDPHTVQKASKDKNITQDYINTLHRKSLQYMNLSSLDPSLALGFLCQSYEELISLTDSLKNPSFTSSSIPLPKNLKDNNLSSLKLPLSIIQNIDELHYDLEDDFDYDDENNNNNNTFYDNNNHNGDDDDLDDEYVIVRREHT